MWELMNDRHKFKTFDLDLIYCLALFAFLFDSVKEMS